MNKQQKFDAITIIVFVIMWAVGLVFADGIKDSWVDYIPITLLPGGIIWVALRLYGFLKFKR